MIRAPLLLNDAVERIVDVDLAVVTARTLYIVMMMGSNAPTREAETTTQFPQNLDVILKSIALALASVLKTPNLDGSPMYGARPSKIPGLAIRRARHARRDTMGTVRATRLGSMLQQGPPQFLKPGITSPNQQSQDAI
jgi:hypothetical protein